MLLLQEVLVPAGGVNCIESAEAFERLFVDGHIGDWNVCDWFCIKVLGPLIQREGEACAQAISRWRSAENLWQARASVVAFDTEAGERQYYPLLLESCRVLVSREERFAKTAVGWILRDISKRDPGMVEAFVAGHLADFSVESLRNALKTFDRDVRERYVQRLKRGAR